MFRSKLKLCVHSLREKRGGGRETQRHRNRGTETEEQRQIYRQTVTERDGGRGGRGERRKQIAENSHSSV